jgi:HK97 family phage major capsid protein
MLTGRRDDLSEPEMLAMHGSSDTGGGYILSPSLSGMLIDLARANAVAFKAGCQTYPMESGEVNIARVATDPTAYWRAETVAVTSSAPVFSRVTLRAKTLACIVPVSIELLEDAANASSIIEDTIARSMGAALDLAILEGNGAGSQPIGVRNTSGINTCTSVGTPTDWAEASAAIGKILVANYNGDLSELSWIMDPVLAETYDNLKEGTTNAPLEPTPWVRQVKRFITTTMPTTEGAGAEHSMLLGHFPSCLVGMRTNGINIRILESGSATDSASVTWNAADQLMKLVVAYLRADVALLQPSWFTVLEDVTHA